MTSERAVRMLLRRFTSRSHEGFVVCTRGVLAPRSLAEIGGVMSCPLVGMEEEPSPLERLCMEARAAVDAAARPDRAVPPDDTSSARPPCRRPMLPSWTLLLLAAGPPPCNPFQRIRRAAVAQRPATSKLSRSRNLVSSRLQSPSLPRTAGANGTGSNSSSSSGDSGAEGDFLLSSDSESEAGAGSQASWSSESSTAGVAALFPMRLGSMHECSGSIDEGLAASAQQLQLRPPLTQSSSIALTDCLTEDEEGGALPPLPEEWQEQAAEQDAPHEPALQAATPASPPLPCAPAAQQSLTATRFSDGPLSSSINGRAAPAGGASPAAATAAAARLPASRAASRSCHNVAAAAAAAPHPPWSAAWSVRSSQSLSDNDRTPDPLAPGVLACSCRTRADASCLAQQALPDRPLNMRCARCCFGRHWEDASDLVTAGTQDLHRVGSGTHSKPD